MISILGRAAILVALAACSVGAVTGFVAGWKRSAEALRWSRWMAYVLAGSVVAATGLMEYALLTHDFSVIYVSEVGSRSTPIWVTIVSLWSSLNGSILLWALMLGIYVGAFAFGTRDKYSDYTPWGLAVAHCVGIFFAFLVAGVANPFEAVSPVPMDGPGPNPLLQNHVLMIIHPPMLYLGFVGMTVPFAMAAAALFAGRIDAAWTRLLRLWMLVPWAFLGVGIVLGGWWSYEVLGWGGWWAWDPVENASFLPWLTATAFLHSAMVMERKEQLKGWTISLVLATFLLTVLGTFMTRSGVFNSVHAFTQSPIGPVFLAFLAIALVFSVVLLAARVDVLAPPPEGLQGPVSREAGFLVNNLLLTAFTFTVLLGTVFPILNESLTGKQISVGEPYFDRMAAPLGLALVFLMAVGPAMPWGRTGVATLARRLAIPAGAGFLVLAVTFGMGLRGFWPLATFAFCTMAFVETLQQLWQPARMRSQTMGEPLGVAMWQMVNRARRRYGGYVVHLGIISIVVAHAAATAYSTKGSMTFTEGQAHELSGYMLTYRGSHVVDEPHRSSEVALFDVARGGKSVGTLEPKMNHYKKMGQPIGTPQVMTSLKEDLYLSLVNVDSSSASIEAQVRPLVWWLWFGGGLLVVGSVMTVWPVRQRRAVPAQESAAATAPGAGK